ncbi:hypothetical protein HPP92_017888 [Vanilla planifolia]|uniref:Uncharacterized protein n=1 Tax=Vanilla planifolia TaxID=51239 RepID=A0A835QCF0_VANPL|nr:hypothetical protein HPP92_017888 [Vanilla planifolia]
MPCISKAVSIFSALLLMQFFFCFTLFSLSRGIESSMDRIQARKMLQVMDSEPVTYRRFAAATVNEKAIAASLKILPPSRSNPIHN